MDAERRLSNDGRSAIVPGEALAFVERLKSVSALAVQVSPKTAAKRTSESGEGASPTPEAASVTAQFAIRDVDLVIKALISAGVKYGR